MESRKDRPLIRDPMAEHCLEGLSRLMSSADRGLLLERRLPTTLTRHIAMRARKYDKIAEDFLQARSRGTIINLGCGFDTRFWRIGKPLGRYLELDLPEVAEVKRRLLGEDLRYDLIGKSVLDTSWIDEVTQEGNSDFLIMAEGLLMYLNKPDVVGLFRAFSERFQHSRVATEVVTEKYTHGIWKRLVAGKMKRQLGLDSGASYNFGVRDAHEIETYGAGIRIIEEWSFIDDPDIRPRIYKYLGLSRTQWTVVASMNEHVAGST